ncbi:24928_t:CDS:2, partial [Gigaspora margarita]
MLETHYSYFPIISNALIIPVTSTCNMILKYPESNLKYKANKQNNANNSEENSDNFSFDEAIENNNATSIVKRIQAATNKCYSDNNMLEDSDNERNSVCTKRRKRQQQHEAAKETPTLLIFWNQNKTNEVDEDDTGGLSEDEIEISNWHKRISTAHYHIPELHEEAKRLKQVLTERGLWSKKGLKLKEAQELIKFAVKKYCSYHQVSESVLSSIE